MAPLLARGHDEVKVTALAVMVDTSQTIGNVVSSAEVADLPLNGRDLTRNSDSFSPVWRQ